MSITSGCKNIILTIVNNIQDIPKGEITANLQALSQSNFALATSGDGLLDDALRKRVMGGRQ
jgi:hypothetical protein